MTKYIKLLTLLVFLIATTTWAQNNAREKIKNLKIAFLTEKLSLTRQEAQEFWPIYYAHEKAQQAFRKKERQEFGSQINAIENLTAQQANTLLAQIQGLQKQKHQEERQFINDLKTVLPSKKIILLLQAEENFKKRLLQRFRNR